MVIGSAKRSGAQDIAPSVIRMLPVANTLGSPPAVPEMGTFARVDGGSTMAPVTAALGVLDRNRYDIALHSIFSISQPVYPADSIYRLGQQRSDAWVTRLRSPQAAGAGTTGWQAVSLARLAAYAGRDSLARRLFDQRLEELASNPAEYSYVSFQAIAALADPTQDSARLGQNVELAERYAAKLRTLPVTGYRTRNDSASVRTRQWLAEDTLLVAYGVLGNIPQVLAHAARAIKMLADLGGEERFTPVRRIGSHVEAALAPTAQGRATLVPFCARLLATIRVAATTGLAGASVDTRVQAETELSMLERQVAETNAWLAMLGEAAPPITAHSWLNTSDSLYRAVPLSRGFNDGRVHVLMFGGDRYDVYGNDRLPILDRMQRMYPADVEVVLVTATTGAAGPDVVPPSDEVAWLARYYRGMRHLTIAIAIWAGTKVSTRDGTMPEPSPNGKQYYSDKMEHTCVVIDGRGIIRAYQPLATRAHEVALRRIIDALLAERRP